MFMADAKTGALAIGSTHHGQIFKTLNHLKDSLNDNLNDNLIDSLPDYRVRISKRARRMRIVVHTDASVEVVVPKGISKKMITKLVSERREWLQNAVAKFKQKRCKEVDPDLHVFPPNQIILNALNLTWPVMYQATASSQVRVSQSEGLLTLKGAVDQHDLVHQALCRWLKQQATTHLSQHLQKLSRENGLSYHTLTIRMQKTRWGSCTRDKSISLNAQLMFLPEDMVSHVLLHELAHLKHMNHSASFWKFLESMDADCKAARKALREAWVHVPSWLSKV
ncbi:MAG: SprT family zinc-dependent metalloprotease [Mariprofundaceae bacterium]